MQRIVWLLIFFLFGTSVFCQVTEVTKLTEEELKAKGWKLLDPQIVVSDGDLQIGPFDVRVFIRVNDSLIRMGCRFRFIRQTVLHC